MCGPAMSIFGAVIQGMGAAMAAQQQANSYQLQAQMEQRQANLERERGSYEGARYTEKGQQAVGGAVAGAAASGINPSTGTTKGMIVQTGENAALDVAAVRYGARVSAENAEARAKIYSYNAASASAAAPMAFLSPVIGAFSSVGTQMGSMFAMA